MTHLTPFFTLQTMLSLHHITFITLHLFSPLPSPLSLSQAQAEAELWSYEARQHQDLRTMTEREALTLRTKLNRALFDLSDATKMIHTLSKAFNAHLSALRDGFRSFLTPTLQSIYEVTGSSIPRVLTLSGITPITTLPPVAGLLPSSEPKQIASVALSHIPSSPNQYIQPTQQGGISSSSSSSPVTASSSSSPLTPQTVQSALMNIAAHTLHVLTELARLRTEASNVHDRDNMVTQFHQWKSASQVIMIRNLHESKLPLLAWRRPIIV